MFKNRKYYKALNEWVDAQTIEKLEEDGYTCEELEAVLQAQFPELSDEKAQAIVQKWMK